MKGYVVRKRDQHYAVIHEVLDPSPAACADAGTQRVPIEPEDP